MVSKVSRGHSVSGALNYNEKKVKQGDAQIIGTANLPTLLSSDTERARFFDFQVRLAPHLQVQAVHMSVNFAASDTVTEPQMRQIAHRLMNALKLAEQPYVLYRHHDAGHDHFHVVSTPITVEGKRISDQFERYHIREETERIEREYGLERTGSNRPQKPSNLIALPPDKVLPVQYPNPELRKSISAVVYHVSQQKNIGSMQQYNAQLNQYNVRAVRIRNPAGKQEGMMFTALQKNRAVGAPIRSSELLYQPEGFAKRLNEQIQGQQRLEQGQIKSTPKQPAERSNNEIVQQRALKQAKSMTSRIPASKKKGRKIS